MERMERDDGKAQSVSDRQRRSLGASKLTSVVEAVARCPSANLQCLRNHGDRVDLDRSDSCWTTDLASAISSCHRREKGKGLAKVSRAAALTSKEKEGSFLGQTVDEIWYDVRVGSGDHNEIGTTDLLQLFRCLCGCGVDVDVGSEVGCKLLLVLASRQAHGVVAHLSAELDREMSQASASLDGDRATCSDVHLANTVLLGTGRKGVTVSTVLPMRLALSVEAQTAFPWGQSHSRRQLLQRT